MIGQEPHEVKRKTIAILKVLGDSAQPLGGRVVSRRLSILGIDLGESAVRYHLKLMDERGLTHSVGKRDGRTITKSGLEELSSALVIDRLSYVAAKIESLAYQSTFNLEKRTGQIPINLSLFPKERFAQAVEVMKVTFRAGLGIGDMVAVAYDGERLGELIVPQGKVGLATVSSAMTSGALYKVGIPLNPKFGGILQIRNQKPLRFVDLIEYTSSSLDPSEVFIAGKMTSVGKVTREGNGKILASFWEIPALALQEAETVIKRLEAVGVRGLVILGKVNEPVCEFPVTVNKAGIVFTDGLNPVAAAVEIGIEALNHTLCGVIDSKKLQSFWDL